MTLCQLCRHWEFPYPFQEPWHAIYKVTCVVLTIGHARMALTKFRIFLELFGTSSMVATAHWPLAGGVSRVNKYFWVKSLFHGNPVRDTTRILDIAFSKDFCFVICKRQMQNSPTKTRTSYRKPIIFHLFFSFIIHNMYIVFTQQAHRHRLRSWSSVQRFYWRTWLLRWRVASVNVLFLTLCNSPTNKKKWF